MTTTTIIITDIATSSAPEDTRRNTGAAKSGEE